MVASLLSGTSTLYRLEQWLEARDLYRNFILEIKKKKRRKKGEKEEMADRVS